MLDIKWIRSNKERVELAVRRKGMKLDVAELLGKDDERKALLMQTEELRRVRNESAQYIARLTAEDQRQEMDAAKAEAKELHRRLDEADARLRAADAEFQALLMAVPNIVSDDTPEGATDADNVELRRVGEPPQFAFAPLDHVDLGASLELFDLPRGVKVGGTRGYYLKGAGLYLHRAVQQLAVDLLNDRGYTVMDVPLLVREESLVHTGFFPAGRDQTYEAAGEGKWLVGTSEVPLVSYHSGEIVDLAEGPIRLAAVSACFRKEAGSAGRDVRGLYRVHQFAKVEQVVLCRNDEAESEAMFREITGNAEELLRLLELPYRIVAVCDGDMGVKNYKQYDIETWMPSRQSYGETHSSSILLDFQARRSNIRYRDEQGQLRFCHTLNNTAVASPRILIPLLENHQQEDGAVYIPEALRKYMNGLSVLRPR